MRLLTLFLGAASLGCLGQGSPETAVLQKLHGKLADAFAPVGRKDRVYTFLLASPGIPVTVVPANAAPSSDDQYLLSNLLNTVPAPSWLYTASTLSASEAFKTLLDFGQVPKDGLPDPTTVGTMKKAQATLYTRATGPRQPSPHYLAYLQFQDAYYSVLDAKEAATVEARNGGAKPPVNFESAEKAALDNWQMKGFRKEIDDAKALVQANFDKDIAIGFGRVRANFNEQLLTINGKTWYSTQTLPPYEQWASTSGWVDWGFQDAELNVQVARAGGLPAPTAVAPSTLSLAKGSFKVTGRFKRVDIVRHWLDRELFDARTWRLAKASPIQLISAGSPTASDPGVMPYLPVGLVLAKDIEICGTWSRQDLERLASGQGTIGPFFLGGPKAKATLQERNGQLSIKAEGIQIIGFLCEVLPKAPNPDPKLVFGE